MGLILKVSPVRKGDYCALICSVNRWTTILIDSLESPELAPHQKPGVILCAAMVKAMISMIYPANNCPQIMRLEE